VVAQDILFMAFIWLFCDNHNLKFNDDNIKSGHLSVIEKTNDYFHILKHNVASEELANKQLYISNKKAAGL
jgi:hypothetical protein